MKKVTLLSLAFCFLFSVSAHADPVDIQGSFWVLDGLLKTKVQRAGRTDEPVYLEVYFGPQEVLTPGGHDIDLAANEVLVYIEGEEDFFDILGTYTANKKGKPRITPDLQYAEDEYELLLPGVVDLTKLKIKAKPRNKNGIETIKVKGKAKLFVEAEATVKVKQQLNASGERFE